MRGGVDHFKITTVWDAGLAKHQRVQIASCCKCPRTHAIHDPAERAKPVSAMAGLFRRKGWRIGSRPGGDLCPRCSGLAPKPALTTAQKRAAFCRIEGVARAAPVPVVHPQKVEPPMSPAKAPATAAAPIVALVPDAPRQPTREDRRRIIEALEVAYLVDKGCYAKAGSDKALADQLKVPRAWVTEERDRAYGPDACEADGQQSAQLVLLRGRAATLESEALAVAERAEALRREIDALHAKMAARGAA